MGWKDFASSLAGVIFSCVWEVNVESLLGGGCWLVGWLRVKAGNRFSEVVLLPSCDQRLLS